MADVTSWTDPAEEPSDTPVTGRRVRSFVSPGPVEVDARNLRGDVTPATGPIHRAQVTLTPRSPAGADLAERAEVHLDQGRLTVDASAEVGAEVGQRLGAALQALLAPGQEEAFAERVAAGVEDVVAVSAGEAAMLDVEVMVPEHSRVVLSTGIGTVTVLGELARCEARSGTGQLHVQRAAVESTRLSTGTGRIVLGATRGFVTANTGTGGIDVVRAEGRSRLTAGVGDIRIARAASGLIDARTGLGAVEVAVPRGTAVLLDIATGDGQRDVRLDAARPRGPVAVGVLQVVLVRQSGGVPCRV